MKSRHNKCSFALSSHSEVRNKLYRLRYIPTNLHRRILTSRAVSYYVKRSMHRRSLIKLITQGNLSTPVIFSLRHFDHLFHRIKTIKLAITVFTSPSVQAL